MRRRYLIAKRMNVGNEWDGHIDTGTPLFAANSVTGTFPTWVTDADKAIINSYPYVLYTSSAYYPRWICSTKPIFVVTGSYGSFYPVVDINNTMCSNATSGAIGLAPATTAWVISYFNTQLTTSYYKNKSVYWNTAYVKIGPVAASKWVS